METGFSLACLENLKTGFLALKISGMEGPGSATIE